MRGRIRRWLEEDRLGVTLVVLAAALLLADATLPVQLGAGSPDDPFWITLYVGCGGGAVGQAFLLGAWAGLGPGFVFARLGRTLLLLGFVWCALVGGLRLADPTLDPDAPVAVAAAGLSAYAWAASVSWPLGRFARWRLAARGAARPSAPPSRRYSLAELLGWLSGAALVLAAARALAPSLGRLPPAAPRDLLVTVAVAGASVTAVGVPALAAVLSSWRLAWRVAAVAAPPLLAAAAAAALLAIWLAAQIARAGLPPLGIGRMAADIFVNLLAFNLGAVLVILGAAATLRHAGLELVRQAKPRRQA